MQFFNFFVRIFGQKCLFLLVFGGLPAITRRYGQFVVIHMSYDKFCLRKNGANSGRTPKNAIFRRWKLRPQKCQNTGFHWMKLSWTSNDPLRSSKWPLNISRNHPDWWKTARYGPFFAENQFSPADEFVLVGLVVRKCHFDVTACAEARRLDNYYKQTL